MITRIGIRSLLSALVLVAAAAVGNAHAQPLDPSSNCNFSNYPAVWTWCSDVKQSNVYTQAWMQGIHTDYRNPYWHTNVHYQPMGGGSDYHNWHIYYCGRVTVDTGGGSGPFYKWVIGDSVTGTVNDTIENGVYTGSTAAEYAASDFASYMHDIVGTNLTPNFYQSLMTQDPAYGSDLVMEMQALMGQTATPAGQWGC